MKELYIDEDNIKYLRKYGKVGLYLILAENDLPYDFETESEKEKYLLDLVNKHTNVFQNRLDKYERFLIDGNVIDESVSSVIEFLSLKKLVFIQGYFEHSEIISNLIQRKNIYLFNIPLGRLNMEQSSTYLNLLKKKKVVKKIFNNDKKKYVFVIDNKLKDDFTFNITSVNDFKFLIKILNDNQDIKQFTLNVDVDDCSLLRIVNTYLTYIDNLWLDLKLIVNLNIHVKSLDIRKVPRCTVNNYEWNINAYGIEFTDYSEFYLFNNIMVLLEKLIPKDASDIEKVVFISNFIVNSIDFDTLTYGNKTMDRNGERTDTSIFDVLSLGSGVCRHYADIATVLFNYFDIKCENISSDSIKYEEAVKNGDEIEYDENGRLVNRDFIGHAFNIVYLDDKPYWLDLTWCDFERCGIVNDTNFLVSSDIFLRGHGKYIEAHKYYCSEDFDRKKIQQAIDNILLWDFDVPINDINNLPPNIGSNIFRNNIFKPKRK